MHSKIGQSKTFCAYWIDCFSACHALSAMSSADVCTLPVHAPQSQDLPLSHLLLTVLVPMSPRVAPLALHVSEQGRHARK